MFTRSSPLIFAAALAGATMTASFSAPVVAAEAAPEATPTYFDNGVLHFEVGDNAFVTTSRVNAPEGPVDVITVRMKDRVSGETIGNSFVTITVFHAPIPGEGAPADVARDAIVAGVTTRLDGATVSVVDRTIELDGVEVNAQRLNLEFEGYRARSTVAGIEAGDAVVVYADQYHAADAEHFDALNIIGATFTLGPAPEAAEAADVEEAHDDEAHAEDDHDDHGH